LNFDDTQVVLGAADAGGGYKDNGQGNFQQIK
jgi:hypothetical protein